MVGPNADMIRSLFHGTYKASPSEALLRCALTCRIFVVIVESSVDELQTDHVHSGRCHEVVLPF